MVGPVATTGAVVIAHDRLHRLGDAQLGHRDERPDPGAMAYALRASAPPVTASRLLVTTDRTVTPKSRHERRSADRRDSPSTGRGRG